MKTISKFFLLTFIMILSSCKKDIEVPDTLKVGLNSVVFSSLKSSKSIKVDSNLDWKVSVSGDAKEWLSAVRKNHLLEIKVVDNKGFERKGTITVHAKQEKQTISVKQIGITPSIVISTTDFTVEGKEGDITFDIVSNVEYSISLPEGVAWISKKSETKDEEDPTKTSFVYTVKWNSGEERKAEILVKQKNGTISKAISITQQKQTEYNGNFDGVIGDDEKVSVDHATASSYQNGEGIEKSYDGDYSTIYHSNWSNGGSNYFPITIEYFFKDKEQIDYLVYYPRQQGYNGYFKEVEIWVATEENPTLKKVMDYDFKGSSASAKVIFKNPILKPKSIRMVIKSGHGDGQGFASCAEMEFYKTSTNNSIPEAIFTDGTCSELKAGVTEEEIEKISNPLYKSIAFYLFKDLYPKEFRIQEYKAYPHPNMIAQSNKTSQYSLLDNPTGIRVDSGDELIVFVGEKQGYPISIKIQNLDKPGGDGYGNASYYGLSEGINKIKAQNKGLIYVFYHTPDYETAPKVKIHFATGQVNGYFDSQKHQASDWERLLDATTDDYFDVVGKKAHLTFPVKAYRDYTQGKGLELINTVDELVRLEQEFMGLMKYDRVPVNRAYFHVMYHSYMYSTAYRTAYNETTISQILNPDRLKKNPWGPAHEVGHTHQTRPGFRWKGMTEVTNNVHSLYVQTEWGNTARIEGEDLSGEGFPNRYEKAFYHFFVENNSHPANGDVFCKLVPFWQLQLYFGKAKGYTDFYKDFYEQIRVKANPNSNGEAQLECVKTFCEVAQTDLTDFFKKWGMLSPVDMEIDDYGKGQMTITQAEIDALISDIQSKGYSKPDSGISYICDSNWELFENQSSIVEGTASRSGRKFTMSGWQNVVAYEVWDGGKLVYTSNKAIFTVKDKISADVKVYAVPYNGDKVEVTF